MLSDIQDTQRDHVQALSLVNTQPQLPTMGECCLGYPVHSSLQMPAAPATIWAWANPRENHPAEPIQPTETWEMINCCFKPLNFGQICYAAIDNQISLSQLVICVNQDNIESLSEWLCLHEETIRNFLLFFVPQFSHLGNTKVGLDQGHSLEITMERKYIWKPDEVAHLHVKKPHWLTKNWVSLF